MKKMRLPLYIFTGVAIIGIILGSIFDLQLSTAIANPDNMFGLTVSAIGPTIGFAGLAVIGGGFLALAIKGKYNKWFKVLFYVLAAVCYAATIYYAGQEYFGVNGFYGVAPEWVGYLIILIPEAAAMYLGYVLFKDNQNPNMWIIFIIAAAILLIALMAGVQILKDIVRRPRFRSVVAYEQVTYHNWWQPCKEHRYLMETFHIHKDNFKSFPSGHTAETAIVLITVTFLPLSNKKYEKIQLPLFVGGAAITFLVAWARVLVGAHYLSDVSWGAFIMMFFLVIANEVIIRVKPLQIPEAKEKTL